MQYRTLGKTGLKVSIVGFGASSLGGVFQPISESAGIRTVNVAIDHGVNFIDVAPFYGLTKAETLLGKALKSIPRDRYYLATKVGRYGSDSKDFDFSADRVMRSIEESLGRLGVGHVDLIQVHDMEFGSLDQIVNETVPALRKAVQAGKARFVGITGLPLKTLRYVAEQVEVDTVLTYCHYELNDSAALELVPIVQSKQIGLINAAPLGMGLLSAHGPPSWHPAPPEVKQKCRLASEHCILQGASIETIAMQYATANRDIATTVVGTADPELMRRNIDAADGPIDAQLLSEVLDILKPIHNITWPSGRPENN